MKKFEKLSLTKFQDATVSNIEALQGGEAAGRTKCTTTVQTQKIISDNDSVGVRIDWEIDKQRD